MLSSEMCRRMVIETGDEWLKIMSQAVGHPLADTRSRSADLTFPEESRTEMALNGVRLVFWVPKGSHTAGDLLVHLPEDRVLVAGDVLVNRIVPTLQDGYLKNWIRTLEEIEALGARHFVPGHGELMTLEDVARLRSDMVRFYAGVRTGFRAGQNEEKIRSSLDLSMWEALERAYVIGRNVNRAYLEIDADSFDE